MFIINRCFKNIWLESQMIHVALFSFQRTTLSFEARFRLKRLCFKRLIYCTASLSVCQELFYFSFLSERQPLCMSCKAFPLKERCSCIRCLSAGVLRRLVIYYRVFTYLSTPFLYFFLLRIAEAIARASHGLDVVRMRRIRFDLLPDPVDMHGHRGTVPQCIDPPDPFKEPFS